MATTYKELVSAVTLTGSATTALYTAPGGTAAAIHAVTAFNPTANPVQVSMYRVAAGGTANATNLIAIRVIPAGTGATLHDAINHKLEPGSQLYAIGNGCGLNVSGVEYVKEG